MTQLFHVPQAVDVNIPFCQSKSDFWTSSSSWPYSCLFTNTILLLRSFFEHLVWMLQWSRVVSRHITPGQGKVTATVSNQWVRNPLTLAAQHSLASFCMTGTKSGQSEASYLLRRSWLPGTEHKNRVSLLPLHTKPTPAFLSRLLSNFPHWLGRELGSDNDCHGSVTLGIEHSLLSLQMLWVIHNLQVLSYTSPYQSLAQWIWRNSKKLSLKLKYQLLVSGQVHCNQKPTKDICNLLTIK